jgi:hypothetical protein
MAADSQVVTKAVFGKYEGWGRRGGEVSEREAKRKSAHRRCCEPTGVCCAMASYTEKMLGILGERTYMAFLFKRRY